MGILTYGTTNGDVEVALRLTAPVDDTTREGLGIIALVRAVEAHVRQVTGRKFEQQTLTDKELDIDPSTSELVLPDRPITTWTSIKEVTDRNSDGTAVSSTIDRVDYLLDNTGGRVIMRSGYWPKGRQAVLVSCVLGFTAAQLATPTDDEVMTLKGLLTSILSREYQRYKLGIHHVQSMALGDESTSFRMDLLPWEYAQLLNLKREIL